MTPTNARSGEAADNDRLRQQAALKKLVERTGPAGVAGQGATLLGIWEHDLASGQLFWSPETYKIFGVSPGVFQPTLESFRAMLHPEDAVRLAEVFSAAPPPGLPAETEYRIVRPDGQVRVLYEHGESTTDDSGRQRKIGVVMDITDRHLAEQEALDSAAELERIVRVQQEIAAAKTDLQATMNLIVQRAQELTGASGAVIELLEGELIVCRASYGNAAGREGTALRLDGSFSGFAIRERRVVLCEDTETDPHVDLTIARQVLARSMIVAPLYYDEQVIGVLKVMSPDPSTFAQRQVHSLQILMVSLGAVIQQQRAAEQLQRSEAHYRLLFANNPQPIIVHDLPALRILAVNKAAREHYGYSEREFLRMSLQELCPPEGREQLEAAFRGITQDRRVRATWRQLRKDGAVTDLEVTDFAIDFEGRPARLLLGSDVTERLRAEGELALQSRAQRMLSACNEALVRAEDETTLLNDICRIAIEIGGYRLAWVGFALQDDARTLLPVAHFGSDMAYLRSLRMTWSVDDPLLGQGPSARTIRSGEITIIDDVNADPTFQPWLKRAQKMSYRGVRALPLRDRDFTFGVLNLYVTEVSSISADETKLLLQMADDLAFGLTNLRMQEERRRIQTAVLKVAAGVSAATGTAFFEQLVLNMTAAVDAEAGVVARLLPGEPREARTIAVVADGAVQDNFTYLIEESPCSELLKSDQVVLSSDLAAHFPDAPALQYEAQAYVGRVLKNSLGEPVGLLCVAYRERLQQTDFTTSTLQIFAARAAAELERQEADSRIRDQASLLDKAQDAIIVRGMDDRIVYWNKSAERLYGWTSAEAVGCPVTELVAVDPSKGLHATERTVSTGEWTGELAQRHKGGNIFSIEGRWTLIRDDSGAPVSIFEINTDITARKSAELEIQNLAFYDPLTKLPNRLLLMDRLHHALASSARSKQHGALLFIDLDNFKILNDTLGHDQGDLLLRMVAERLQGCVRSMDSLARLGGDEFVVMLEGLSQDAAEAVAQARSIGEKTLNALNQPYLFPGYQHHSTCSIGITLFSDQADNINDLLKRADLAMYQAKAGGRNTLRFFDPEMQKLATARVILEADLRHGLRQQEFVLHYQPQVNGAGKVLGVEALVRWKHSRRGLVPPMEFIPFAEETGLILPLGLWVLETACTQLAAWGKRPDTAHLQVAVNVSARQFRHVDFVAQVLHVLSVTGASPHGLKLELTESLLLDNVEETIARMTVLQERGVGFALDDFGTGYSSLSYLKRLPLDQLKIDKSFVRDVLTDPNDAAIARTIVALSHSLGLTVMAEGVETEEQRAFLAQHNCDAYQGYLFSKPLTLEHLEEFLAASGKKG